ncbi:probable serine/threonine-protein kinase DDB_G0280111 [Stomoxys calcitrans]|uniref:Tc1-like transposase DDE domain-containing protein n=1 Tax=Stomoxys calcitrans TaxID=35570 RepID=A0A1I8NPC4_STOCA|nr:probable serine/threonine-protein kinase DDB_G0280111 [Stomoxys calcitrans]XP_013098000.1 probable serine/threonine-protein kinase DDB_G0280111 [Stomoxys calcitrans]XP_013098001.1 probable serine/threonine-protein kinase DDB_G0280111 [Stomoxys calcitrans]
MKTLLLSSDDIQNFRKLIYDPKVANLGASTEDANLMALQYYLKHPGNYTSTAAAAAAAVAATSATATVTSQIHIQRSHPQTPTFLTTTAAAVTPCTTHNNNSSSNNNNNNGQPASVSVVVSSNNGVTGVTNSHNSHHAHHHLLAQSQTQLKQLQLKQPTIHHHQHAASFHHPYYQQHSTPAPPAHAHTHSTTTHNSYSHSVPVHALNQNSNFSAASSSTGGGTASSHAPTQQSNTTGSSLSPPGTNASARTTPSSGSNSSGSSSSTGSSSRGSVVSGAKKLKIEPVLSQFHQTERLSFANSHVNWTEDHWRRVVFQDERKFNLDGPDGFSYYFHDLRNYERTLSQRPRGNSVYIYLVLTAGGPIHLEVSTAKFKIESCVETILRERANIVSKLGGNSEFFLQDHNWTTNALPSVQEWLNAESIKTQKWPTVAHDLNIMEGIWGWLIREVFDGGRKFSRKDDLIFRIREAWSRVPMELISNLYTTLSERMTQLYYTRGAYTNC